MAQRIRKSAALLRLTGISPLIYTHECHIQQHNRKISAYFQACWSRTSCFFKTIPSLSCLPRWLNKPLFTQYYKNVIYSLKAKEPLILMFKISHDPLVFHLADCDDDGEDTVKITFVILGDFIF